MKPAAALRETSAVLRGGADGTPRDANYLPARFVMIALRERLLGRDDPKLGASLASAASGLLSTIWTGKNHDDAVSAEIESLIRRAIPLQIAAYGPDSPLVGQSYNVLATTLVEACRLSEATEWFVKDCELWMRQPRELHDDYQIMLRARWTAWHATRACVSHIDTPTAEVSLPQAYELGLRWSDRAISLVNSNLGAEHGANAMMYACRAFCLAGLHQDALSLESESRSLSIVSRQPVPEDQRCECGHFIGLAQLISGRVEDAKKTFEAAWVDAQKMTESLYVRLEWSQTMLIYCRRIGDEARAREFEEWIRMNGRGDIMWSRDERR